MKPEMVMGIKMKALCEKPRAARLQATTLAMAALGVYSPPFDRTIDVEALVAEADLMEQAVQLPIKNVNGCAAAFKMAVEKFEGPQ